MGFCSVRSGSTKCTPPRVCFGLSHGHFFDILVLVRYINGSFQNVGSCSVRFHFGSIPVSSCFWKIPLKFVLVNYLRIWRTEITRVWFCSGFHVHEFCSIWVLHILFGISIPVRFSSFHNLGSNSIRVRFYSHR